MSKPVGLKLSMNVRRAIRDSLLDAFPRLGAQCVRFWDGVSPVVNRRMPLNASIKYLLWGFCPGLAGKFKYFGTRVYFPKGSAIFRMACEKGTYEPDVTEWLCRLVRTDTLFIDVGANIGLTSIPVLRAVQGSRVLSFEPSPNSLPYLERTRRESEFERRWSIVPGAAAESEGIAQFYVATPEYGAWDGFQDTKQAGKLAALEVPQTTLDAQWRRLGCPSVSCIKIDVEGAETKVLRGADEVITRERPYVLLEWSQVNLAPHGTEIGALLEYARSRNYDVVAFPSLSPVTGVRVLELHMLQTEMFLLVPRTLA
jgi:FkbM family methyltransferase